MRAKTFFPETYLLCGLALLFLIYIPRLWDPSVYPKFFIATTLAFSLLPITLKRIRSLLSSNREIQIIVTLYSLLLVFGFVSSLISDDFFTAFFGLASRYNGFIGFHLALFFLLIGMTLGNSDVSRKFLWILSSLALFESLVGIAQKNGFILIVAKNLYSPIIGTFGNPNFLSAFLGFGSISSLFLLVASKSKILKLYLGVNLILSISVMYMSESIQGLFMFALGMAFLLTKYLQAMKSKIPLVLWLLSFAVSTYFVILGLLNRGIFATFLYQDSTFYRFDYWRAALRMIAAEPFFGVGPDQFPYSYIIYRDSKSMERDTNIVSDSAHNMYLQVGATYGLLYSLIFLMIVVMVLWKAIKHLPRTAAGTLDLEQMAIGSLWLAFIVQAAISVDTVSALVPGFLSGGLVMANYLKSQSFENVKMKKIPATLGRANPILVCISLATGFLTLMPMYNQLTFVSKVRDFYSAPGTSLSADEINRGLRLATFIGDGDRYLWSRITAFRYSAQDKVTTSRLLNQLSNTFPKYPTIADYQAQFAVNENQFETALQFRQQILAMDPVNVVNIRELIIISKKLQNRSLYDQYVNLGKSINNSYFSNPDLNW